MQKGDKAKIGRAFALLRGVVSPEFIKSEAKEKFRKKEEEGTKRKMAMGGKKTKAMAKGGKKSKAMAKGGIAKGIAKIKSKNGTKTKMMYGGKKSKAMAKGGKKSKAMARGGKR
jgi:hypothetical protein